MTIKLCGESTKKLKSVLPNYILNLLGDRMEMAHSVEGRVPFLDRKTRSQLSYEPRGWAVIKPDDLRSGNRRHFGSVRIDAS